MASNSVGKFARDTSFVENLMEYKPAEIFTGKTVFNMTKILFRLMQNIMVSFYDNFLPSYAKPKMSRHELISRLYGNSCNFHLFSRNTD